MISQSPRTMTPFSSASISASGRGGVWVHALRVNDDQIGCIKFSYFTGSGNRLPSHHACVFGNVARLRFVAESFGLPVLDSDGIRDLHKKLIVDTAAALDEGLGERAMQIHLQRIVGAFVGSAHGAGQFYSRSVTEARDATAKGACDDRDEDVGGPVGFDSASQRKREFAADMALQAHALRMAAEAAVAAYEHVVGEAWKPFERPVENPGQTVDRKAAELQMAALG